MVEKSTNTYKDFNISAEKYLANKMKTHDLKEKEIEKIWEIVKDRDATLEQKKSEQEKYRKLNIQKEEIGFIKNHEKNKDLSLNPPNSDFSAFKIQAYNNVINKEQEEIKQIKQVAEKRINQVFDNARNDNRDGKQKGLSQEFNQARDQER